MNKNNLKSFAPQARKDFIAAVTVRAQQLGFTATGIEDATLNGDVLIINGVGWPARVSGQREKLKEKISQHGFAQTMEEVAYTWFNRFAALRYMELHDFLDHGHRVLSSRDDGLPELLRHASEVTLPGLNAAKVQEMQLAGNRDNELYKLLLVAQCNELSRSMPFLFERIDDETELLLPDNLLRTDSIIAKLVAGVPEDDWKEIEVIGWLYQFYISEKKDQVIGKVVKSEDIPAATQLFTPNWIVQYLVQNSVGRLWLMANPQSTLAKEWPYYITPAEQTPEVQAQLDALIQTRVREDGDTLNPESITVLDPACGSGHILVVAYDVLKAIYLERGYRVRDIPRLILEKNLYGLDIDDRAAQMAGFALLMKARADDRRLFTATDDAGNLQPPKLNVLSLQESKGLSVDELATHLAPFQVQRATITALVDTFEQAKTFGSLIQITYALKTHLAVLPQVLALVKQSGDMYASAAADDLLPLVQQAQMLAKQFDAVVANPPYMGGAFKTLTNFMKLEYRDESSDLFACFIERGLAFAKDTGISAMITLQSWMFSSSYENLRTKMIARRTISSLIHVGFNTFPTLNSKIALGCMFSIFAKKISGYVGTYVDLNSAPKSADKEDIFLKRTISIQFEWDQEVFEKIPGSPISYSISDAGLNAFLAEKLGDVGNTRRGLQTGNKDKYIRYWYECNLDNIELRAIGRNVAKTSPKNWFLFNNGGDFRRWYGNVDLVVCWGNDGSSIKAFEGSIVPSEHLYFESAICWSRLTYNFGFRLHPLGVLPGDLSPCFYPKKDWALILAYMNSSSAEYFINIINPSLTKAVGDVARIPIPDMTSVAWNAVKQNSERLVEIYKDDWVSRESAYEFKGIKLKADGINEGCIEARFIKFLEECHAVCRLARNFEESNNKFISSELGLSAHVSNDVPIDRVSLFANSAYRYGGETADVDQLTSFKLDFCIEIISYAIGSMMGRYSLDEPGLIYAHAGNVGFEPGRYTTFPADADGIVPITDELWFADDACSRIREFLRAVWGPDTLDENMAWLAESLCIKSSETPEEAIRRYIADKFFKDHLQTYKKRPIYWLFSSGKQGAFQALVYLHRYNESTLARMRAEYVIPLTAKMASRLEMLEQDANAASSAAARTKIRKQIETLRKKQTELLAFDENLRHFADMRITLDLDDGVKVNYGKFGDLLDGVKAVTGGASDE